MLGLISAVFITRFTARCAPGAFAALEHFGVRAIGIHHAAGTVRELSDQVCTIGDLPALAEHFGAVGISELDHVVVEDVAIFLARANLASAHPLCLERMRILDPVADVEVVDVLLANMIAAKPGEEVPVPHLEFELRKIAAWEWLLRRMAAVPVATQRDEIADRAVANLLYRFEIRR